MVDCNNSKNESQPKPGIIYKLTNLINGKIYVGQTTQTLKARMRRHKSGGRPGVDSAIQKYGWENFKVEIIEKCPHEKLNEREVFGIQFYDCMAPKGYNLTAGGSKIVFSAETRKKISSALIGHTVSAETRAKISASKKGTPSWNKGRQMTDEQKRKISLQNIGRKRSEEVKAKMSKMRKGKKRKPFTAEHRAKLSAAGKGKISPRRGVTLSAETKAKISATKKANRLAREANANSNARLFNNHD